MTARARWMGLFVVWGSGCAEPLVIGAMRDDASADTSAVVDAPVDRASPPDASIDVAPPPDIAAPMDTAPESDTPRIVDVTTDASEVVAPLDAPDVASAVDASDVATVADASDVADDAAPLDVGRFADAPDVADVADGPAGTPLPAGWCSVGDRCYVDPNVFQLSSSDAWVDACAAPGAQRILVGADDEAATVSLPFEFLYAGRRYTQAGVSSNGAIGFPTVLPLAENQDLPYRPMGDALFPLWTDLQLPMGVCVATVGAAPSRRVVIEYVDARRPGAADFTATFEVNLHEGNGAVSYGMQRSTGAPGLPTVGYQELGGVFSGHHYRASAPPSTAVTFRFEFSTRITDGVGVCHAGAIACGAAGNAVCAGMLAPSEEVCNGLDDDCDGVVDDCATCGASRVCSGGRCVCPPGLACDGVQVAGVTTGFSRSCAWRVDGTVACWGSNWIGDGCNVPRPSPTAVPGLRDVVEVSVGGTHTCARRRDGTVACWGGNRNGQVGDATTLNRPSPVEVPGITDATSILAASDTTCALSPSGATRCWGSNLTAQVGDGSTSNRLSPVLLTGVTDAVALRGSIGHTCALRATGGLVCWGFNGYGAVGDGTDTTYLLTPTPVVGMSGDVTHFSVGGSASFARRGDGRLFVWGLNSGPFLPSMSAVVSILTPVELTGFGRVAGFTTINGSIFAWRDDGSMLVHSHNMDGQVGDGTTSPRLTPTAAPHLAGMRIGRGTGSHVCALRDDGSVWCWGNNIHGQIGDGTTASRLSPVRISL